jgi:hypothetical protein
MALSYRLADAEEVGSRATEERILGLELSADGRSAERWGVSAYIEACWEDEADLTFCRSLLSSQYHSSWKFSWL